jgi:molybdopterin-guanine dinucleotide biosynthesis protein B
MKAIAVIGYHHTGKTTTVLALVRALTARGYKVATIKDIHSGKYRADSPGKNSALHVEAGSIQTVARGLYDTALIYPRTLPLNEIIAHLQADFLVIEGMKDAPVPKIVCAKEAAELPELIDDSCIGISGIIASEGFHHPELPGFKLPEDAEALCDTALNKCFELLPAADPDCCSRCGSSCLQMAKDIVQGRRKRSDCVLDGKSGISLTVDGKAVQIVPFVQDILKDSILAIVKNLRDIPANKEIEIRIKP